MQVFPDNHHSTPYWLLKTTLITCRRKMTNIVLRKTQESFRKVLVSLCDHVIKFGDRGWTFFGLRGDIIRCIFALTYAKEPQFVLKRVQGKGIYRTKFHVNLLAFQWITNGVSGITPVWKPLHLPYFLLGTKSLVIHHQPPTIVKSWSSYPDGNYAWKITVSRHGLVPH